MGRAKRSLGVAAALLCVAVAVAAIGSLGSLDWGRRHAAETAALPVLSPGQPDGLVRIAANGMEFRGRVAGLAGSGTGVILLHGFPETSAMWGPLLEAASAAGHRVVAFDQRGYSPGARPESVESYEVPELIGDVLAVADAAGFEQFHLVGHDWGCIVGWGVAIRHSERLHSWSGLSIPHPGTLLADLQSELPAYIKIFTAPFVPEVMLSFNGFSRLFGERLERLPPDVGADYRAAFAEPGALTGGLNWYRAITTSLDVGDEFVAPVAVPTLFLYGTREGWVTDDALARQREFMAGPYQELELDAGHFLIEDQPEAVVEAVMGHLARNR